MPKYINPSGCAFTEAHTTWRSIHRPGRQATVPQLSYPYKSGLRADLYLIKENQVLPADHDISCVIMGSDEYYGLYDNEIDMNFSTYSKPKRNTQPIQLKQKKNGKNKKKAKSSGSIEKVAVAPSTSKIKDSALKPDTTESETKKKTMELGLFPAEIMDLILEEVTQKSSVLQYS